MRIPTRAVLDCARQWPVFGPETKLTRKEMARLGLHTGLGLVLVVVGIYGLLLAFAGAWHELAQAWGSFSLWCWDLAHGFIKIPPATFRSTLINAELTWMISSIF